MEGPRGAKLWTSEETDTAGDGGTESSPFPSPGLAISTSCLTVEYSRRIPSRNSAKGESSCITLSIVSTTTACCGWYGLVLSVWRVMQLAGCMFRDLKNVGKSSKGGESIAEYDISELVCLVVSLTCRRYSKESHGGSN